VARRGRARVAGAVRASLLLAVLCALAIADGASSGPSAPASRFLLVYVTDGQTLLAQSRDGVRWSAAPGFPRAAGTAPSTVRRGRTLYVFDGLRVVPEGLAGELRRLRIGDASLTELPRGQFLAQIATPQDLQRASAVSGSIARDASGLLTLLYALRFEPETNACPVAGEVCVKVRTATEERGSDGTLFTGDPRNRAVVGFAPGDDVRDPAALATARGHLVVLSGPRACLRLLTAGDLHGPYRAARGLPGGCIGDEVPVATPSGAYRPFLKEHWLYAVAGGRIVRAATRTLAKQLPARRFRPIGLPARSIVSARFALNTP
jgi:hypothetical protein